VPYELKEAISGEVVLVEATLYPRAPARACLTAHLPLLDPGLELLLEGVRQLVGRVCEEVVTGRGREAGDNTDELPWQVCEVGLAEHALVLVASLRDLGE
jgi:hypothetical protein